MSDVVDTGLVVSDVCTSYGPVQVLHDISLRVGSGEAVAVLGANGAGKTTLLRTISGLHRPTRGDIKFEGRGLVGVRPDKIVRLGLAHVPEGRHIFANQTVLENLLLGLRGRWSPSPDRQADVDEMLDLFPLLADRLHVPGGDLSGGQQQVLAIARGLMSKPRLLLLDEPSLGLAPVLMDDLGDLILRIREEQGIGVLLVDQNTSMAMQVTSRTYVLQRGRVVAEVASEKVAGNHELVGLYLGDERMTQ